jgi:RNA recognition motif-containing protein
MCLKDEKLFFFLLKGHLGLEGSKNVNEHKARSSSNPTFFNIFKMPSSQRVYIGNIPSDARERDVEKFFKGYGRINDVVVKNGYGFVEFDDHRYRNGYASSSSLWTAPGRKRPGVHSGP